MRTTLAVVTILLLVLGVLVESSVAQTPSSPLEFTMKPTSADIGATISIMGTANLPVKINKIQTDNIRFYFGNASIPIANVTATFPANKTSAIFYTSFYVPLVDAGTYNISASDSKGNRYSQSLTVSFGADTLISDLKLLNSSQSLPASDLSQILNQLGILMTSNNTNNATAQSQLTKILEQIPILQASLDSSISSLQTSISTTNSNFQSLYYLLVVFVALEGLLVGLVVVLLILTSRKRSPRMKPEEVEIIES